MYKKYYTQNYTKPNQYNVHVQSLESIFRSKIGSATSQKKSFQRGENRDWNTLVVERNSRKWHPIPAQWANICNSGKPRTVCING